MWFNFQQHFSMSEGKCYTSQIPTFLMPKYGGKFGTTKEGVEAEEIRWGDRHPLGGPYLAIRCAYAPHILVSMVLPMVPFPLPTLSPTISCPSLVVSKFPTIFWHQKGRYLVNITFSLRPEETLLEVTLQKLVLFRYLHSVLLMIRIWI